MSQNTMVISIIPASQSAKMMLAVQELRRGLLQLGFGPTVAVGTTQANCTLRFILEAGVSVAETYTISVQEDNGLTTVTISGAGEQALLYGIFDFLERQGAFFGVDGEIYPIKAPTALNLPTPDAPWQGEPRFATRGLLPWPDFLNCITMYNREDFRAYLEAMLRMRFNTLGIHVYGQTDKWVEPFLSFEYGGVGHAAFADTTATDRWGYLPQRTSRYSMSAAQYFDDEVFGSDATRRATSPWEAAEMSQQLWREAFDYAEQLGIKTGVGFELYQLPDEIVKACPQEVRKDLHIKVDDRPEGNFERHFPRIDPASRTARYLLETRLANLLAAYPSVSYVYLWEDEMTNWVSQHQEIDTPVEPFLQAHDFLRRHAPDKRLVIAGWGGVARNFERFHRELPGDIIFTALSDQFGWDPVHDVFSKLEDRERWPIPWIEDDPSMWQPQLHVNRFDRDMTLAEDYGCQGVLGIHWRHRIIDPVAGYMGKRMWERDTTPAQHYQAYAGTQTTSEKAPALAEWFNTVDANRHFLTTWTGNIREDGHHEAQEFSGDYHEAFDLYKKVYLSKEIIDQQAQAIAELTDFYTDTTSPLEQERLGFWLGQSSFLDPYAKAWQVGQELYQLIFRTDGTP